MPTTLLDQMLDTFPEMQFLKIDVEGAEELVLKGGSHLQEDIRPQIYVEVGAKQSKEVTELLHSVGYTLFDGHAGLKSRSSVSECAFNTLAIPSETVTAISRTCANNAA